MYVVGGFFCNVVGRVDCPVFVGKEVNTFKIESKFEFIFLKRLQNEEVKSFKKAEFECHLFEHFNIFSFSIVLNCHLLS